jgi:hypothetical protein
VVWCGVVWCGVVWCGVVWCVVWCGVVWRGVVWCVCGGVYVWCACVCVCVCVCGVVCGVVWVGGCWSRQCSLRSSAGQSPAAHQRPQMVACVLRLKSVQQMTDAFLDRRVVQR